VGIGPGGRQTPVICVERSCNHGVRDKRALAAALLELAQQNELTRSIKTVLWHPSFPVDIRHNSKIFREKLAVWAEKQLQKKVWKRS
jgi:hypothetical protein